MLGLRATSFNQPANSPRRLSPMGSPTTNGHHNGDLSIHENGEHLTNDSSSIKTPQSYNYSEKEYDERQSRHELQTSHSNRSFSSEQQVTILEETIKTTRSKLTYHLKHFDDVYVSAMTLDGFLDYIERQRLSTMPRRGSRWDKVLKWAEFFGLQISGYAIALDSFVPQSKIAAQLIWASCRTLIELGSANSQAIETAFAVLYKIGLSLSFFLRHTELLSSNHSTRVQVSQIFNDLLILVRDITLRFHNQVNTLVGNEVSLDFNHIFGANIDKFYSRKGRIIDEIWKTKIKDETLDIHALRSFLSVQDSTSRTYLRDKAAAKARRDEYTCDWVHRHLLDFTRGNKDILAITGPSGCGKSVLSGWILERLQRPIGKKSHETFSISIDIEIRQQYSLIAIAKSLALQLLSSNVGDVALLKALKKVHEKSLGWSDNAELESGLWESIHTGLRNSSPKPLIIVIDGLDDRCGHQTALDLSNRIADLTSKHKHVQAIVLARNATHFSNKKVVHHLPMTPDETHFDIQHIAEHALEKCKHYAHQGSHEKEAIVEKLTHVAKGNFLWIKLIIKYLELETSHDGFMNAVKAAHDSPKTLDQLIHELISLTTGGFSKAESLTLLSWLIAAERPLTIGEIRGLLQIDLQKKTIIARSTDTEEEIKALAGPLVKIQNGVVKFWHTTIREQLLQLSAEGKKLRNLAILQGEMTLKLLLYCKLKFSNSVAVTLDVAQVDPEVFHHDALLEYASRRWIYHFKQSNHHNSLDQLNLHGDFKALFPSSVQLANIEWSCWRTQASSYEAVHLHNLALRIRQETFTENHQCVLQNLIGCGSFQRELSRTQEASACFYRASRIGRSILKTHNIVTVRCTALFLEITNSFKFTTRTEVATHREDCLRYVISVYTHQHGKTSELVVSHLKLLTELYVSIHEEENAEKCRKEIREITVIQYGEDSDEQEVVTENLDVVLKKSKGHIVKYKDNIFDTAIETDSWSIIWVKQMLKRAIEFESSGHLLEAEECYVLIWSSSIEYCQQIGIHRHHVEVDVYIAIMDITLEYSKFLHRHHRHEEACSVLICIWSEYEEYDFESEIVFIRLRFIGELMRTLGLLSIAVSVFKKCWSWFKFHEKHEHILECETFISETIEEITVKETKTVTTKTTTTTVETTVKEIFETSVSKTIVTKETVLICQNLVSLYIKSEKWAEAIKTATRSLELVWKVILTGRGVIALPREFSSHAIEIAIQLALCHHKSNHFHEAEEIYLRIYHACFSSCGLNDERFTRAYGCLLKFYEDHEHWDRMIHIYEELLLVSRKQITISNALTIKLLYKLGSICTQHGHGNAYEYYEEIIDLLNGSSKTCHADSFKALEVLCRYYYEQGHWKKLKVNCEILWEYWTHHHKKHNFDAKFVELLYARYVYVLENHFHVEYEILRRLTIEFRDTCVLVYGAGSAISIRALIELAHICMRSETHIHEAITHYEEVIKTTKTTTTTTTTTETVSTSTLTSVKEKLSKAYVVVCSKGTVSTETTSRAILIITERFEHLKVHLGCSHTETLKVLRELILLHLRVKTEVSIATITKILLENTINIITKEKHSKALFHASKCMGALYRDCGLVEEGRKLLRELHLHIVFKAQNRPCGYKIDHTIDRSSFVFLATFEEILHGSLSISYSKIMADLLTESILFESYSRSIKSEKDVEIILGVAAKFYVFLEKRSRKEQLTLVQNEVHRIFINKWGSTLKSRHEISIIFVTSLLRTLGVGSQKRDICDVACKSGNTIVSELLSKHDFQQAYEVALCAFSFGESRGAYRHQRNIGYGFKLSSLMATPGGSKHPEKNCEPELQAKMLELSRRIISVVLKACRDSNITFARMKLAELNDLVALLGDQKNYSDLEWVLSTLWSSREVQKEWSPSTIVALAKLLIQTQFLQKQPDSAIRLAETICYNLRRVYGALDLKALDLSDLLSQIYIAAGHYNEAMRLHEEILRLIVDGDDFDDRTTDTVTPQRAVLEVELLKQCFLRLKGWDKSPEVYHKLVDDVLRMPGCKNEPAYKALKNFEGWSLKEKPDTSRDFKPVTQWRLIDTVGELGIPYHKGGKQRDNLRRITSNWGMTVDLLPS